MTVLQDRRSAGDGDGDALERQLRTAQCTAAIYERTERQHADVASCVSGVPCVSGVNACPFMHVASCMSLESLVCLELMHAGLHDCLNFQNACLHACLTLHATPCALAFTFCCIHFCTHVFVRLWHVPFTFGCKSTCSFRPYRCNTLTFCLSPCVSQFTQLHSADISAGSNQIRITRNRPR